VEKAVLTVDLEPDWGMRGVAAFRRITPRFLRFLERRGLRATFFVVSDLMDVDAALIAAVAERNEIASHGRSHSPLRRLSRAERARELRESRECLEQAGRRVEGFRAPFFQTLPGWPRQAKEAGYRYDASLGSVLPGPHNGRLDRLACPHLRKGIYELPTSAMCQGMLPFSLTYLRLTYPLAMRYLPRTAPMLYIHLHEFLPAETASVLPVHLRALLTRNCGERAWQILERCLDQLDCEFATCAELVAEATEKDRTGCPQRIG